MKRDKKQDSQKKLLKLERSTVRQLEQKDLERANGGRADMEPLCSICGPSCM